MLILRKEECDGKTKSKTDGLHREVIPLEHCLRLEIKMVKIRKCLKAFQKGSKHLLTLEKGSKKKRCLFHRFLSSSHLHRLFYKFWMHDLKAGPATAYVEKSGEDFQSNSTSNSNWIKSNAMMHSNVMQWCMGEKNKLCNYTWLEV